MTHFGWICAAAAKESSNDEIPRGPLFSRGPAGWYTITIYSIWLKVCMFQLHTWNWYHVQIRMGKFMVTTFIPIYYSLISQGLRGPLLGFLASPTTEICTSSSAGWNKCIHTLVRKKENLGLFKIRCGGTSCVIAVLQASIPARFC